MNNRKLLSKLMFRLLTAQVLLVAVGAVNGIVSSFFASNYIGVDAMSAVGLYSPINMLFQAISTMIMGGSVILCGKYMGQNKQKEVQNVFSLNLLLSTIISLLFVLLFIVFGIWDLTGFLSSDETVRPIFNQYLLGQSIGILPLMLGRQLPSFLAMENKDKRTLTASIVYVIVNVVLNYLFVVVLGMGAFGLALASSIGMWIFLAIQAEYYVFGKSHLKMFTKKIDWHDTVKIITVGFPGAASNAYETIRGLIVNYLIVAFVGSVGLSAFAAADNLLRIFWSIPFGMIAVSRIMMSISIGEEDRQTLADVMRVMFRRFVPLMCCISALLIICAVPLTNIFYHDPSEPVYMMTVWGLRILPICMPFSIVCMHFVCYGQASGKQFLVHLLSLLAGVVCVAGFTALLIRFLGMNSVYIANVMNGVVCVLVIICYSIIKRKSFPKNVEQLMVIPDDFGVAEDERMDISIKNMDEVVSISEQIQSFCLSRGIDERRSYLAGLSMEEMAGNIVDHGFTKDKKKNHSVDVRVVHKNDDVILRLKDDCVPFNPIEREKMTSNTDDVMKNIGLRIVLKTANDVQYQNIMGLNVLTIRI